MDKICRDRINVVYGAGGAGGNNLHPCFILCHNLIKTVHFDEVEVNLIKELDTLQTMNFIVEISHFSK